MTVIFRGRFDCKADSKGRLSLPAGLRSALDSQKEIILTTSLVQGFRCLDLYLPDQWRALETRIQKLPSLRAEVQAFQRFYLSSGQNVPIDNSHRILIPSNMRKYAQIDEELVLVGMGDKLEVWSLAVWSQLFEGMAQNFGDITSAVAVLEESP